MITTLPLDPDKLLAVLMYLTSRTKRTKFVLCKLLFLADAIHLAKYGRPIIGGKYNAMPNGPVPSQALDLMNNIETGKRLRAPLSRLGNIRKRFRVEEGEHPILVANETPDLNLLSVTDQEILDLVIDKFSHRPVSFLWKLTHRAPAYINATEREPESSNPVMAFDDFFEGNKYVQPGAKEELWDNYVLSRAFPARAV